MAWFTKRFRKNEAYKRVYYSLAVWRLKPILSAVLRFHLHLSGGLRLRNYRAVAGKHKFSLRFSVFACFCGGYSNRVKILRRLSGNFIFLNASLFKGPFVAATRCNFCRAKVASSFEHVRNPCDIAATNRTESRT